MTKTRTRIRTVDTSATDLQPQARAPLFSPVAPRAWRLAARLLSQKAVKRLRGRITQRSPRPGNSAFFFKQAAVRGRIREVPLLDGRRWAEFPGTDAWDVSPGQEGQ